MTLTNWFINNKNTLCKKTQVFEHPEWGLQHGESLAKWLWNAQNRNFGHENTRFEDEWFDELYEFRESHSLSFALRGANVPDIIVGLNNEIGEISFFSLENEWAHQFDMGDFCISLHKSLVKILKVYKDNTQMSSVKDEINKLIFQLNASVQ